jgi:hypothetical protein
MRTATLALAAILAVPPALAAQDIALERATLGSDSTFGPGIVEVAVSGSAVKVRLDRPAHLLVVAFRTNELPRLVWPRQRVSRASRAGDHWMDLIVTAEVSARPFVTGGDRGRADQNISAARQARARLLGANVALVMASDQPWDTSQLRPLLPDQPDVEPMFTARTLAQAVVSGDSGPWAAWIVRW